MAFYKHTSGDICIWNLFRKFLIFLQKPYKTFLTCKKLDPKFDHQYTMACFDIGNRTNLHPKSVDFDRHIFEHTHTYSSFDSKRNLAHNSLHLDTYNHMNRNQIWMERHNRAFRRHICKFCSRKCSRWHNFHGLLDTNSYTSADSIRKEPCNEQLSHLVNKCMNKSVYQRLTHQDKLVDYLDRIYSQMLDLK